MTEVPEHLLRRSCERRAALGLGGGDAGGGAEGAPAAESGGGGGAVEPTAAAPAGAAPVPVAAAPPPPPKPVPTYVQASLRRKRVPLWIMPVLGFLPIWAIIYVNTLSKAPSLVPSQLEAGATTYSDCSGCHGGSGEGGAGRPLNNGSVVETFPYIADQLEFVWLGSAGTGPKGTPYGAEDRPGGQHKTNSYNGNNMPNWDETLTQSDLLNVVRHEREVFGGEKVPAKQIGPDGELLWPNGTPVLDPTTSLLVNPDGKPMFDADGKLTEKALVESKAASTH